MTIAGPQHSMTTFSTGMLTIWLLMLALILLATLIIFFLLVREAHNFFPDDTCHGSRPSARQWAKCRSRSVALFTLLSTNSLQHFVWAGWLSSVNRTKPKILKVYSLRFICNLQPHVSQLTELSWMFLHWKLRLGVVLCSALQYIISLWHISVILLEQVPFYLYT